VRFRFKGIPAIRAFPAWHKITSFQGRSQKTDAGRQKSEDRKIDIFGTTFFTSCLTDLQIDEAFVNHHTDLTSEFGTFAYLLFY
jgi:hypothetical protein